MSGAHRKGTTTWPAADCDRLRQLWDAGMPCTEIAAQMGKTKNQVIGRAHRMHLKPRPSPLKYPHLYNPPLPGSRRQRAKKVELRAPTPDPVEPTSRSPAVVLNRGGCQWIAGEPTRDDSCKCGAPTVPHRPYCEQHEARVWSQRQARAA